MALTVLDLLSNGAARAREVQDHYRPRFTRAGYVEFMRGIAATTEYDYLA
jgi:hypothetical protein